MSRKKRVFGENRMGWKKRRTEIKGKRRSKMSRLVLEKILERFWPSMPDHGSFTPQ